MSKINYEMKKSKGVNKSIRNIDSPRVRSQFNSVRKLALELGLKSDLPLTLKEYKAQYTGSKVFATSDYYYEWFEAMKKFYVRYTNRAIDKLQKADTNLEIHVRTQFPAHSSQVEILTSFEFGLNKAKHVLNPNYLATELTKEGEKLIKKTEKRGHEVISVPNDYIKDFKELFKIFNPKELKPRDKEEEERWKKNHFTNFDISVLQEAGLRSNERHSVSMSDFGGSYYGTAYNNFLVSLSKLGYTNSLTYARTLTPGQFNEIFKRHRDTLTLVYKYEQEYLEDYTVLSALMDIELKEFELPERLNKSRLSLKERNEITRLKREYEEDYKRRLMYNRILSFFAGNG